MAYPRLTPRPIVVGYWKATPVQVYWSMDDWYVLTFFEPQTTPGSIPPKEVDYRIKVLRNGDPRLMVVLVAGEESYCRRFVEECRQPDFIIVVDPDKDKLRRIGVEVIMDENIQPGEVYPPVYIQLAQRWRIQLRPFRFPKGVSFPDPSGKIVELEQPWVNG